MYPSWGNFGGPQSQNYGGPGPRQQPSAGHTGQAAGFGGFEASATGSLFSSLQEQHLQQMQQLQMLHQKQLQSVLHHNNAHGAGYAGGYCGTSWQPEGSGHSDHKQDQTPGQPTSGPPAPQQVKAQPPPPPPQPQPSETQPAPPPEPPEKSGAPKEANTKQTEDDKSLPLQDKQQLWYKQHLQNLQKLKQEKAKQNQKDGDGPVPPPSIQQGVTPPSEPTKGMPPPPPPKEEPPAPPPPPEEARPEVQHNPEEVARLQQLQAAAVQWQQVQQQRAGVQYQALMQQHEKLQHILEQYQQLIKQPENLQSMSPEMQLRHFELQLRQFTPLFQDWDRSFRLWHEQFLTYHHKDQLKDYELQWKQWQEQMSATNAHLQERVATLTAMVPFASNQYNSGVAGQYGLYPGQDIHMQQSATPDMQHLPAAVGPRCQGPRPPNFGAHAESSGTPAGTVRPPAPPTSQPPRFNNTGGPRPTGPSGNNPNQPQQGFDGPPRFDQSQQRFNGPSRFNQPPQCFDGPPRFDQPQQRFDGPPRFDQPRQCFDGPPRFDQPRQCFDGPPRFDQPRQRFDGPPRFEQRQRFDGPPRFEQRQRFDGPPRFEQRQRFDGPPRFEQRQRFDGPPRFDQPPRHPAPPSSFERPPVPQQIQQKDPQPEAATKQPASMDSKTAGKSASQPKLETEKSQSEQDNKKANVEDMTDDNLLGTEDFFVQNDPIPQTSLTSTITEESKSNNASNNNEKPQLVNSKPSVTTPPTTGSNNSAAQTTVKPDGPLKNNKPPLVPKLPGKQEPQVSGQIQPKSDISRPTPCRGRGQPLIPVQGRGRGQMGSGEFSGANTVPLGETMGESSYAYNPPEEDFAQEEGQQDYYWQDPSYEECGGGDSELPTEEMWMPEEQYFPTEEEYYEESMGGHPMGRGGPPMMRGGPSMRRGGPPMGQGCPPMGRGGPPMGRGGPPMGRGGPPMGRGGPPMGRGGPPMGRGGPPMGRGGPPMGRGGPPMNRGGPPMNRGGPPMNRGGPPMGRGGPPMGRGGPPMGRGGPPMGRGGPLPMERGGPMDMHWEEPGSGEYLEEGDSYWGEERPPMRGMRPPFPAGRGCPPRGHPGFMQQGRGRPPHPAHGPMDHERLGNDDDTEIDPVRHPMYPGSEPHSYSMHPDAGRGRYHMPPPPHEMMDPMEESLCHEGMEEELGWQPPHGRGRPLPPHEIMDRGGMTRRPMGRGMARGMQRPGPKHGEYEDGHSEAYVEDYGHGADGYRWRPPQDYPSDEYRHDAKYHESEWDRERVRPDRDYPTHMPSPDPYRDGHWIEERERGQPYPYDDRGRGELRIREYRDEPQNRQEVPPRSEWDRSSRLPPPPERRYPADYEGRRAGYEDQREEAPFNRSSSLPSAAPVTKLPESPVDPAPNVLALSQHQHEIILKAAQELKFIREMKEGKAPAAEPQRTPTDILPELPAGLLGLEIPPDVRDVLKGMTVSPQTAVRESVSVDTRRASTEYQSSLSVAPVPAVMPKTVDYGHGHEPGATVERISYGERIVLRPDPMPSDRSYDKESFGPRDPYNRDPYYERRFDPYMDRREYSRERELLYREKPEYERDRYERERYPPRERERSPLAPSLRSAYRERERDHREKDRSGSRDRDEYYGRTSYDRPPYERSGLDRSGLDRSGPERYSHSSSPYGDRRSYPEDRGPPVATTLPPPPQPPPRVEKKPEIKNIDDILKPPGRLTRPERIVIIMRGLPGSGKSHVAKLIRDKEVDSGGAPPRILGLDDYFMTEVEKVQKDKDTGKRVKTKVLEYEYEPEMEDTYRSSLLKTFKKTLDDGFFPFIILDIINDRVKHFDQFWSAAKTKGFEVYLAEITADTQTCAKRNVHGRTLKDIMKMSNNWEPSPRHMVCLDVRSLLQDAAIEEVEMEDFNPDDEPKEPKGEEEEEADVGYIPKSKWEMDTSEAKLDKLDGLGGSGKRKREDMEGLDNYLQLPDDYATRTSQPGKKRVRWADLEEQKDADRKRAIGFVVGQTDWEKITDESGKLAQRALNRTKYF